MASVNDRLGRLEARRASFATPHRTPPIVDLVMKEMNAQRLELDGRPPDPANEPTPEELEAGREASKSFLETTAALMRAAGPGPAALEGIAQMEEQAKQHLSEGSSA